ncbi:MAG: DUF2723 domain-containing protein [bacterium]
MNKNIFTAVLLFIVLFGLFLFYLCPDVFVGDSGEFITTSEALGIAHSPGYPLYSVIGKFATVIFPFGNTAYRINLYSALTAALCLAVLFLVARLLGIQLFSSIITVLLLALNADFLSTTVNAEVFMLNAFFASCLLWILFKLESEDDALKLHWFYCAVFLFALGLGNHHSIIFYTSGFILLACYYFLDHRIPIREMAGIMQGAVFFICLGLSIYAYVYIRSLKEPFLNWGQADNLEKIWRLFARKDYGTFTLALGEKAGFSFSSLFLQLKRYFLTVADSFYWITFICSVFGWVVWYFRSKRQFYLGLVIFLSSGIGFFIIGNMPFDSQSTGILGRFYILSILVLILGFGFLIDMLKFYYGRIIYAVVCLLPLFGLVNSKELSLRNAYFAYDYGKNIFKTLPLNAYLFIDGGDDTFYSLAYLTFALNKRRDVHIHDRGGLVFNSAYGEDFRNLSRNEKEIRRQNAEKGYLKSGNRVFYSTMNRQILEGVELESAGFLFEADHKRNDVEDLWELYSLRGIYTDYKYDYYYRLRALLPYYPFVKGMSLISGSKSDGITVSKITAYWNKAFSVGYDVKWLKDNIYLEGSVSAYHMFQNQELDSAEILYSFLTRADPQQVGPWVNLGAVYERKGDLERAKKYYIMAIGWDPMNLDAHYNLGVVYWGEKNWQGVVQEFQIVYNIDPNFRNIQNHLRRARYELQKQ